MDAGEVTDLVDREAELVGELSYRLAVIRSLALAGEASHLRTATEEARQTSELLRLTTLLRVTKAAELSEQLRLGPEGRLGELAERLSADESAALLEARRRLVESAARARHVASLATSLLGQRVSTLTEALEAGMEETSRTYERPGLASHACGGPRLLRSVL